MGKSLVIKGADFSANGIPETLPSLDITQIVANSGSFKVGFSLSQFQDSGGNSNSKRCCIVATRFSDWGIDISQFSKIEITIKDGYDYVFGTGPVPSTGNGWQGWNGEHGLQPFNWITTNQKATATINSTTLSMSLNLRYDDNTTDFSESTVLTDIVDSIVLVP